jgi:hypothetical protein
LANKASVIPLDSPPVVTRQELALRYQISVRTIDRWIAKRMIPVMRLSPRCLRFDIAQCDAALRRFTIDEITKTESGYVLFYLTLFRK